MERRRFRRPRLSLNVQACSNDHAVGHVLNLTDEGVCLTGRGAPPAEPFPLKFERPLPVYGQREIHVLAEPRWHDYLSNGHWRGGFYLQADNDAIALLTTLAGRYGDR